MNEIAGWLAANFIPWLLIYFGRRRGNWLLVALAWLFWAFIGFEKYSTDNLSGWDLAAWVIGLGLAISIPQRQPAQKPREGN